MADTNTVHVGSMPPQTGAPNYDVRLVTVERDVAGLRTNLDEIKASMVSGFKELGEKFASKSSPNWAAIAVVAGLIVPALGWGWSQLSSIQQHADSSILDTKMTFAQAIAKQEAALAAAIAEQKASLAAVNVEQKTRAEKFVDRADIVAMLTSSKEIADLKSQLAAADMKHVTTDDIKASTSDLATKAELAAESKEAATRSEYNRLGRLELRERVIKLEDNIVSRREHEIRNTQVDHAIEGAMQQERRDVDEIKRRLDDLYPTSTVLKDLTERTHALEIGRSAK